MGEPGLSAADVAARVADGRVNTADDATSRPLRHIIRSNVATPFNALLAVLGVIVLSTGRPGDALFLFVVVINAVVGIGQELRAKRALDRLAIVNAPTARVRRDGAEVVIPADRVVLDDRYEVRAGDQVVADAEVLAADGLEVDESLLTGESDAVRKQPGDALLSGSIVTAGSGLAVVTAVGADAYARRITADAKRFSLTRSELQRGTNTLLKGIAGVMVVVGPILLWNESRFTDDWREAVVGAAAGLVGMVPEGLVLLTSLAFLLAALALARRQVLAQELPAVEVLARVDVVCLDKTGTITEGTLRVAELVAVDGLDEAAASAALGALAADPSPNPTFVAIAAAHPAPDGWTRTGTIPFSSARKWSAASFDGRGTFVLGAPEIVLARVPDAADLAARAERVAGEGRRVVALCHRDGDRGIDPDDPALPELRALALVVLDETIRPDAAETFRYFAEEGVTLKVISGDNPRTVLAVARRAGLPADATAIDARTLPADDREAFADALDAHTVFGRVTPEQKRAFVHALQARGHVVAMTGDGVNDALALKDADIGVAMGSGAPATRAVAQLVLMDGKFSHLPHVVAEGRRVIANIERVANLFVIKNVYSAVLAVTVALGSRPYPFLPRHLTVISSLTIGIPAFLLSLAPNTRRYRPGFLQRLLRFALPTGVIIAGAAYGAYTVAQNSGATTAEDSTAATVAVAITALWVVVLLARPLVPWKLALVATMAGAFVAAVGIPPLRDALELALPKPTTFLAALAFGVAGAVGATIAARLAGFARPPEED